MALNHTSNKGTMFADWSRFGEPVIQANSGRGAWRAYIKKNIQSNIKPPPVLKTVKNKIYTYAS